MMIMGRLNIAILLMARKIREALSMRLLKQDQGIYRFHLKKETQFLRLIEWYTETPNAFEVTQQDAVENDTSNSLALCWSFDNRSDKRKRVLQDAVIREKQGVFRKQLEKLSHGLVCAVTGCSQSAVIQAAHLAPYLGPNDNDPSNGILLRADIHLLFDRFLLGIEPDTLVVALHDSLLQDSQYRMLDGVKLQVKHFLSPKALHLRWKWFQENSSQSIEVS